MTNLHRPESLTDAQLMQISRELSRCISNPGRARQKALLLCDHIKDLLQHIEWLDSELSLQQGDGGE